MCGITGILDGRASSSADELHRLVARMTATLAHRGPDGEGTWIDAPAGIALGHRRLKILDLSPAGDQPMTSADGRFVLTYNGEIYNHAELRRELGRADHSFRGHSDTEVLVESIARWGVRSALDRSNGMFAFGVWDRQDRRLTLARDRMGEKPLYYATVDGAFVFSSELRALRTHPRVKTEIDRDALVGYLRHNNVGAPRTIYTGVYKLPPGHTLVVEGGTPTCEPYWTVRDAALAGAADRLGGGLPDAVDALESVLSDAVGLRMVADVPVGAFLSGGIDSSLVVALMQRRSSRGVRTFTIGFKESDFDEAQHAKRVAQHLGTDHTELYVTPSEALDAVPRLPVVYDEPFADSSQLPTFLVSSLARRDVTVALTGDGGDELFAGYTRYLVFRRMWRLLQAVPAGVRRAMANVLLSVPAERWNRVLAKGGSAVPRPLRQSRPGDKLHRLAVVLPFRDPHRGYLAQMSQWPDPEEVVLGASRPWKDAEVPRGIGDLVSHMQYLDQTGYLPDDILTKVDRASMAVSLETRIPLLDHRVVELAWRFPTELKFGGGTGKLPTRALLGRYVPAELVDRPKMGFGVPIFDWLRGPLRDWADGLLEAGRLRRDGLFDARIVRAVWEEHLRRTGDWIGTQQVWGILMFNAWLDESSKAAA